MAISDNSEFLYAAVSARGIVQRYRLDSLALDLEISLGEDSPAQPWEIGAILPLPGKPRSLLVARRPAKGHCPASPYLAVCSESLAIYDGAIQRQHVEEAVISSLSAHDGTIWAWGHAIGDPQGGFVNTRVFRVAIESDGPRIRQSSWTQLLWDAWLHPRSEPSWSGPLLSGHDGSVFSADTGRALGRTAFKPNERLFATALSQDSKSIYALRTSNDFYYYLNPAAAIVSLDRYSLDTFHRTASVLIGTLPEGMTSIAADPPLFRTFGSSGLFLAAGSSLFLFDLAALTPADTPHPTPIRESTGIIRLPLPANSLAYDPSRDIVWAAIPGHAGSLGNSIVSIEPASGSIRDVVFAGSEPDAITLDGDFSRVFTILTGASSVRPVNLNLLSAENPFFLSDPANTGYWSILALARIAGQSNSVIVSASTPELADKPASTLIAAYDAGVPRSKDVNSMTATSVVPAAREGFYYAFNFHRLAFRGQDFRRINQLRLDSTGIHMDRALGNAPLNHYSGLVPAGGNVYTGSFLVSPEIDQLRGHFAADGLPVPMLESNRVAYAIEASELVEDWEFTVSLKIFDSRTFQLQSILETAASGRLLAAVSLGSDSIVIATDREIAFIPLSAVPSIPPYATALETVEHGLKKLKLPVNAIASIPGGSRLLVATPGAAGALGNNLLIVDPANGSIERSGFIGAEPSKLAVTRDGRSAFAWLAGEWRIARMDLSSGQRDLVFVPDPAGRSQQYGHVYDMAILADGGLAISYPDGAIAIFDDDRLRPDVDWNDTGNNPPITRYVFAAPDDGNRLYVYNQMLSTFDLRRFSVEPRGLKWLTNTRELIIGHYTVLRYAGGLIYTNHGEVVDPELARMVARLTFPPGTACIDYVHRNGGRSITGVWYPECSITLDPAAGRAYVLVSGDSQSPLAKARLLVFDLTTFALTGERVLPFNDIAVGLEKCGPSNLAFLTERDELYFIDTATIPPLPSPLQPQKPPGPPTTENVSVVDLDVADLAYSDRNDRLYATVLNREASRGDSVAEIELSSGRILALHPAGLNPAAMALSVDKNLLLFLRSVPRPPFITELASLDTATWMPAAPRSATASPGAALATINDFLPVSDAGSSVLLNESDCFPISNPDFTYSCRTNLRVYDGATPRPNAIAEPVHQPYGLCVASTDRSALYCGGPYNTMGRFGLDETGLKLLDSFSLPYTPGLGTDDGLVAPVFASYRRIVYHAGRLFTPNGHVIDANSGQLAATLPVRGPVAIHGNRVYWLKPLYWGFDRQKTVELLGFDLDSLQQVSRKVINVANTDVTALIPCSAGRFAFRAGGHVYIISP